MSSQMFSKFLESPSLIPSKTSSDLQKALSSSQNKKAWISQTEQLDEDDPFRVHKIIVCVILYAILGLFIEWRKEVSTASLFTISLSKISKKTKKK
jgi:hypothetical protein